MDIYSTSATEQCDITIEFCDIKIEQIEVAALSADSLALIMLSYPAFVWAPVISTYITSEWFNFKDFGEENRDLYVPLVLAVIVYNVAFWPAFLTFFVDGLSNASVFLIEHVVSNFNILIIYFTTSKLISAFMDN